MADFCSLALEARKLGGVGVVVEYAYQIQPPLLAAVRSEKFYIGILSIDPKLKKNDFSFFFDFSVLHAIHHYTLFTTSARSCITCDKTEPPATRCFGSGCHMRRPTMSLARSAAGGRCRCSKWARARCRHSTPSP
jgi:hypothetical protein